MGVPRLESAAWAPQKDTCPQRCSWSPPRINASMKVFHWTGCLGWRLLHSPPEVSAGHQEDATGSNVPTALPSCSICPRTARSSPCPHRCPCTQTGGLWAGHSSHPSGPADYKYKQFTSCCNLQWMLPVGANQPLRGLGLGN